MRSFTKLFIFVLSCALVFAACSKKDEQKDDRKNNRNTERKSRPKKEKIPEHLLWAVSTKAKSRAENDIKKARRGEDVPPIKLKKLFELAGDFFEKKQPISEGDSVVKFVGFDFAFFVPNMEPFEQPSRYALYRRGSEQVPAAISIVDSLGPNNIDVFPFYYENTVLYFIDFYGMDVTHKEGKVIPGFFVDDFSGDAPLYFQPVAGKMGIAGIADVGAIMQLGDQLVPERQILLEDGWVTARSQFRFRDTLQSEQRYSYRFGKACDLEWLEDDQSLLDLIAYIGNNRCGGAVEVLMPSQANNRLPLWVEEPGYAYTVTKERNMRRVNVKDSATAWMVHSSGGKGRPKLKEMPDWRIGDLVAKAGNFRRKVMRPEEGKRLRVGAGWDLRKFAVDTDKPGVSKRSALYELDKDGFPTFISLIDSNAHGLSNLEVFPFGIKGAVVYFLHYFEKDAGHGEAVEIPGFFLYSDQLRKHYHFRPAKGMKVGSIANLGAVMELENELQAKKALVLEKGKAEKVLDYRYEKEGLGKDKRTVEMRVTDLLQGEKACAVKVVGSKTTLDELADFMRSPRCGEQLGARKPLIQTWYYPIWVKGVGLEAAEEGEKSGNGEKENEKTS